MVKATEKDDIRWDLDPKKLELYIQGKLSLEEALASTGKSEFTAANTVCLGCVRCTVATIVIPNSVVELCNGCWQPVWLSPAGVIDYNKNDNNIIMCEVCLAQQLVALIADNL